MLTGAGQKKSTYKQPITGLGVVNVVAVNPTNDEYKTIVGKELPYPLTYEAKDNTNTNRVEFPVRLLVYNKDKDTYGFLNFSVAEEDDVAKTGSIRYIDSRGAVTWSRDLDTIKNNEKMAWFDSANARPLKVGEYALYKFIQTLTSYDGKAEGANFLSEMGKNGISSGVIFSGNIKGLKDLFSWSNKQNYAITVLFTVEEKVKDEKTLENQRIISNPDTFFYTDLVEGTNNRTVSNYSYKALKQLVEGSSTKDAINIKGYATYKLQDYKKEDCFNLEPSSTQPEQKTPVTSW